MEEEGTTKTYRAKSDGKNELIKIIIKRTIKHLGCSYNTF